MLIIILVISILLTIGLFIYILLENKKQFKIETPFNNLTKALLIKTCGREISISDNFYKEKKFFITDDIYVLRKSIYADSYLRYMYSEWIIVKMDIYVKNIKIAKIKTETNSSKRNVFSDFHICYDDNTNFIHQIKDEYLIEINNWALKIIKNELEQIKNENIKSTELKIKKLENEKQILNCKGV